MSTKYKCPNCNYHDERVQVEEAAPAEPAQEATATDQAVQPSDTAAQAAAAQATDAKAADAKAADAPAAPSFTLPLPVNDTAKAAAETETVPGTDTTGEPAKEATLSGAAEAPSGNAQAGDTTVEA
jgi:hypothetical protein